MKFVIFNADDFGYGHAINRGVIEAHRDGVVTAATLVVNGPAALEAARLAADNPRLSVGLHVNFTNEAEPFIPFQDPAVCRSELRRQFDRFVELLGRLPAQIDSHQHVHRFRHARPIFQELAREHGLPLRDEPPVVFKGGFYGQWEYGVSDPSKVSVEALERILRNEIHEGGIYEFCVHPGYVDPERSLVYHREREMELRTLCDPAVRRILEEEGIGLISFDGLRAARAVLGHEAAPR
jgi:predicted glycoside hydrolase/deacetylase ChbG (UPF0249 family)